MRPRFPRPTEQPSAWRTADRCSERSLVDVAQRADRPARSMIEGREFSSRKIFAALRLLAHSQRAPKNKRVRSCGRVIVHQRHNHAAARTDTFVFGCAL